MSHGRCALLKGPSFGLHVSSSVGQCRMRIANVSADVGSCPAVKTEGEEKETNLWWLRKRLFNMELAFILSEQCLEDCDGKGTIVKLSKKQKSRCGVYSLTLRRWRSGSRRRVHLPHSIHLLQLYPCRLSRLTRWRSRSSKARQSRLIGVISTQSRLIGVI